MADGMGPIFGAGFQTVSKNGYKIQYLPDANNDQLQREGKPPIYHWLPNEVRLARKANGDFKFSFLHFVGVRDEDTNVGTQGHEEVAGGLVGFSTTSSPPDDVLNEANQELINRFRGNDDNYWGWRTPATPMFRPAPIVSNTMSVTSLTPGVNGQMPSSGGDGNAAQPANPAPSNGPAGPAGPAGPPNRAMRNRAPLIRALERPPVFRSPRSFALDRAMRGTNLDVWYANLQGQGPGSISPFAENAFSGLLGSYPAAMMYASFHGGTSAITVWNLLQLKVWSPICTIDMVGDWSRIQDHFSAAAHAGGWFWSADLKAEFNSMRQNGTIVSSIKVDQTLPGADKIQQEMEKRSDLVFNKFMEQAQKVIFDPAPFKEEPAQASGGFLGLGGGGAVKLRRDRVSLHLEFHEQRQMAYLQPAPISGQLEGLYDEIKANPEAEKKYFSFVDIGNWDRKITRVLKPVVNWPDPTQKWVGQPVAFLSAQVGYPDVNGELQWSGHIFQASDGPSATWKTQTAMKKEADVANPPQGWKSDRTFIKRQVHFGEPPNETENPFVRVSVEKNVVDLDAGESGAPLSDINLEIRVDNVGAINLGPVFLNVDLENDKQIIEVTFQPEGKTLDGHARPPVKFSWKNVDQTEPRYWMMFTGDPDYLPKFKYQVRVLVKGSIFTKGKEWIGPWQEASGNGPIMLSVPTPEDPGVVTRELVLPTTPTATVPATAGPAGRPPGKRGLQVPAKPVSPSGWTMQPPSTDPAGRGLAEESPRKFPPSTPGSRSLTPAPATEQDGWVGLAEQRGGEGGVHVKPNGIPAEHASEH
jgi:hypothetical protein